MKKIIIVLAALLVITSVGVFAQSYDKTFGFGLTFMDQQTKEQSEYSGEEYELPPLWGLTFKWKVNPLIGFSFDFIYVQRKYWDYWGAWYQMTEEEYESVANEADSEYKQLYHDEWYALIDIMFFLPLGPFQPFFGIGFTSWYTTPSDAYDSNLNGFADAYDASSYSESVGLGTNVQLGFDIFVSKSFSIAFQYVYLVEDFADFKQQATFSNGDINWDYINNQGYFKFGLTIWG